MNESSPIDTLAMEHREEHAKKIRYFSLRGIALAAFLGGPLAAGVLLRENWVQDGRKKDANNVLVICIVLTIIMFAGIFALSDGVADTIPRYSFSIVFSVIAYYAGKHLQGSRLDEHARRNGAFHSIWSAVGVAFACAFVSVLALLLFVFLL